MKRLFQVSAITILLMVMASVAYAAATIRSTKSNTSERVVVSDSLTPAQATAFLAEWDKMPLGSTTDAAVRGILQKGPNAVNVKLAKIIIRTDMKPPRVIVLENSMLEAEALAFSVPGTPSNQAATGTAAGSFPTPGGSALPAPPATRTMSTEYPPIKLGPPPARINVQDCNAACQRQWGPNASALAECEARCRSQ